MLATGTGTAYTFSLTYDGNGSDGGIVPTDANAYTAGDEVTVATPGTMSRNGYTFSGWNTARDGNGALYFAESSFTMGSEDVTLYAQWSTIAVQSVSLNTNTASVEAGQTYVFTLTIQPSNATNKTVSWSSSNTGVAQVDGSGSVMTFSPGETTITVTTDDGARTDSATLTVLSVPIDVSGIVSSDTTWSAGNRYRLTDDVQVAYGSTLTIQPGVEVIGQNYSLQIYGRLAATGTSNSRIQLNDLETILKGTNSANAEINVAYAKIDGGAFLPATGNATYGSVHLHDSIVKTISYVYVWYPVADSSFERNIFLDSGGISIGRRDTVTVYVRNNVFSNSSGDHGEIYAVENWASYNSSATIVEYNTFLDTDQIALRLPSGHTDAAITATNNYWNTTDTSTIESMIFDNNDDLDSAGSIPYSPFLTSPQPTHFK